MKNILALVMSVADVLYARSVPFTFTQTFYSKKTQVSKAICVFIAAAETLFPCFLFFFRIYMVRKKLFLARSACVYKCLHHFNIWKVTFTRNLIRFHLAHVSLCHIIFLKVKHHSVFCGIWYGNFPYIYRKNLRFKSHENEMRIKIGWKVFCELNRPG